MEAQMQIAFKLAPALARAGVNTDLTMPTTEQPKALFLILIKRLPLSKKELKGLKQQRLAIQLEQ